MLASTDDALKKSKDLLQAAQRKNKALKKTVQEIEHELNQTEKKANTTSHNNTTAMELVQKDHALLEAQYAEKLANEKLSLVTAQNKTNLNKQKLHHGRERDLFERLIKMQSDGCRRESLQFERSNVLVQKMSNQCSVNMLKAQMISGGSANETGNLFGTALASEFFSPGSPARRMIRRDSSEDRIAIGNETPKCLMLESSTDLDESRGSGKGDIRDKTMGRFRALQGTLHTLDGDLKEQVQQTIRSLEEEVKRFNQEIATELVNAPI